MLLGCWQVIIRPPWHPVFFKTHIGVLIRIVHLVPQILELLSELKELPSKKYRTLFKSWHVVYNWSPSRLPDGLTTLWVGYSAEEHSWRHIYWLGSQFRRKIGIYSTYLVPVDIYISQKKFEIQKVYCKKKSTRLLQPHFH